MEILIVDDELLARQRLVRMAEKIDIVERILEAENAMQAMQVIEGPAIALIAAWVGKTRLIDNQRLVP